VIAPDVGGAFGARASVVPEDLLVPWAAWRLRRSLRWVASRSEEFTAGMHGRGSTIQGQLSVSADGLLQTLDAQLHFALGAWMPFSSVVPLRNAARILPGPYQVQALSVQGKATLSNASAVNIYRGAGRPEAVLLTEVLIERAARALRLDPMELRRRNLIAAQALPYLTPTGETLDSGDYPALLERACGRFDYPRARREQAIRRHAGECVGVGVAVYVEPCGQGWESARVTLHDNGRVTVASGSPAQGQGHTTVFAQIAAEALGCDESMVDVDLGDTAACPDGVGALASRSTAIGGSAIVDACRQALARRAAGDALPLTVETRFTARESWASGCVMAQVAIDSDTGELTIERVVWVDDAGRLIHPALVHGQLLGGFAQGMGQALMERVVYDEAGQLLTGSLMDYAVPRASDMPDLVIESLGQPTAFNLLGAKGVGEAGCIGVPAAIMNAALDALSPWGEADLQFPLTAPRLWQALSALRSGSMGRLP
jgi:carbon-monoxide dehydrogenase large subunit